MIKWSYVWTNLVDHGLVKNGHILMIMFLVDCTLHCYILIVKSIWIYSTAHYCVKESLKKRETIKMFCLLACQTKMLYLLRGLKWGKNDSEK